MNRSDKITAADINQWIDNDEGLYNWHRSSRQSRRNFIRENRAELEAAIRRIMFAPCPSTATPYDGRDQRRPQF